jgi:hypothetical protein
VLLDEFRLLDPVIANIKAKCEVGAELAGPETVAASITGAIQEPLAPQAFRINVKNVLDKVVPQSQQGNIAIGLATEPTVRREDLPGAELLSQLNILMPRPQPTNLFAK